METINSTLKQGNKLKFLPKLTLSVLIITFLCLPKLNFGQAPACNYLLTNASSCDLDLTIVFYDSGGICNTISNYSLLSSQQYNANCGSCGTLTDVMIYVNLVNGNTPGNTTTLGLNAVSILNYSTGANCSGSNNIYGDWHPNSTDFHD